MLCDGSSFTRALFRGSATALDLGFDAWGRVDNPRDDDASAYIAAIEATGVRVSLEQKKAITSFVIAEKSANRWTSHKRLYLPIWGVAAANAICIKSLNSGTFVGSVTHGAGFVKNDLSTGHFDFGVSPATLGLTVGSGFVFALIKSPRDPLGGITDNSRLLGSYHNGVGGAKQITIGGSGTQTIGSMYFGSLTASPSVSAANRLGIITLSRSASNYAFLRLRRKIQVTMLVADSTDPGTVPTLNLYGLAQNQEGSTTGRDNSEIGAFGVGLGFSESATDDFTANLKTLWETCTGLTLP